MPKATMAWEIFAAVLIGLFNCALMSIGTGAPFWGVLAVGLLSGQIVIWGR